MKSEEIIELIDYIINREDKLERYFEKLYYLERRLDELESKIIDLEEE